MKIRIDSIDDSTKEAKHIEVDEDFCITIPNKGIAIEIKSGMFSPDGVIIDVWKALTNDGDTPLRTVCIGTDEIE